MSRGPAAVRKLFLLALTVLVAALGVRTARAERVKDLASFEGARVNALVGYGIVVGLNGTGDDNLEYVLQGIRSASQKLGLSIPAGVRPSLKNAAAVMVTAELPPFTKPGQQIDVTVSALGKAKSLRGGTLLMAALSGADGEVYAIAQGNLAVGGLGVDGKDGSKVVVNVPSAGRIPGGATVERPAPSSLGQPGALRLDLHRPDITNATRVAAAINSAFGQTLASATDPGSIALSAPPEPERRLALMARIEAVEVTTDAPPARVVVNARTGTIVIGGSVRVLPAAVAHGSLTVRITENDQPSQPTPLSGGRTVVSSQSAVAVEQAPARAFLFAPGVALSDIVDAINRVGAAPADLVAILEALREAGALRAELVVI